MPEQLTPLSVKEQQLLSAVSPDKEVPHLICKTETGHLLEEDHFSHVHLGSYCSGHDVHDW